jgi:hypothetical protein
VVVPEREDSRDGANEEAKDDVEAVMAKIEPTRAGDEDGGEERKNTDEKKIEGRRGSLTPSSCYVLCVRGEAGLERRIVRVGESFGAGQGYVAVGKLIRIYAV